MAAVRRLWTLLQAEAAPHTRAERAAVAFVLTALLVLAGWRG